MSASSAVAPARRSSAIRRRWPREYADLGVDTFILSGYPHLEEAWRFGELVLPLLPLSTPTARRRQPVNTGPFGETIANDYRPAERRAAQS